MYLALHYSGIYQNIFKVNNCINDMQKLAILCTYVKLRRLLAEFFSGPTLHLRSTVVETVEVSLNVFEKKRISLELITHICKNKFTTVTTTCLYLTLNCSAKVEQSSALGLPSNII